MEIFNKNKKRLMNTWTLYAKSLGNSFYLLMKVFCLEHFCLRNSLYKVFFVFW